MSEDELYQCQYQYVNGELSELTGEERAEHSAMREEWAAGANSRLAASVRKRRNDLLRESDVALLRALERENESELAVESETEAGINPAIAPLRSYRQALRDVPAQPGFPNSFSWPTLQN